MFDLDFANITFDIENKFNIIGIEIRTNYDEFKKQISKLKKLRSDFINQSKSFSIKLHFDELNLFFGSNKIYFVYDLIITGIYPKNYNYPNFLFNLSLTSQVKYQDDTFRVKFNTIVNLLQDHNLTDIQTVKLSNVEDESNFDDIKFAIDLNFFEKTYGNEIKLDKDIRLYIYSLASPTYNDIYYKTKHIMRNYN